jgi:hypothetical protein
LFRFAGDAVAFAIAAFAGITFGNGRHVMLCPKGIFIPTSFP